MRIAIVGAGMAGLAAAWRLRDTPVEVEIFEKSAGVSGRAASRSRHGARFDFGANYFKLDNALLEQLVLQSLPAEELVQITAEVWTFDAQGRISPGDPAHNSQARWTYSSGISTLGKLLAEAADAVLHRQCHISALRRRNGQWLLEAEQAKAGGSFDAVLLTPPAPQSAALLARSDLGDAPGERLLQALGQARYHAQFCFALGFRDPLPRPENCFALINSDRAHDIAWLSFENDKPGRDLGEHTVAMVQMAPDWSARRLEQPADQLLAAATDSAMALLAHSGPAPVWSDSHRWRYAHPYRAADSAGLDAGAASGLYFAGDALVGKGRIGETLQTGLDAAARVLARL